jgi:hypothetical protein
MAKDFKDSGLRAEGEGYMVGQPPTPIPPSIPGTHVEQ